MELKIVPDTSVVVDGRITEFIREQKDHKITVIIPNVVISELEHQANLGKETGFDGLKELKNLKELEVNGLIEIKFHGQEPSLEELKFSKGSRIDDIIRKTAEENNATLITSDYVQSLVAQTRGIDTHYIEPKVKREFPKIFGLFDSTTMSIHLKENTPIMAKKGDVAHFELVRIGDKTNREQMDQYAKEIVEYTKGDPRGYIEIEQKGATVIQLSEYRIVIARPPFSDGIEITAVKPLVKTKLSDYDLSEKLLKRLESHAEGIFVAGAPGAGKTTFVQAVAEFYQSKGKIIKTMEQPRDLQVGDEITQYAPLEGSMEKTSDILLLVRPDYTIYDELRKTSDFRVFADMRLAGVGLVGVCHSSRAIDAIQRLVGRVELGVIPHIVDTVIFIDAGKIKKVYELKMTVKIPHGMREADLARPVIEVRDFESGSAEYELYSYGEEVVVIPVRRKSDDSRTESDDISIFKTKKDIILRSKKFADRNVQIYADNRLILSARINRAGNAKIRRNSESGRLLVEMINSGKRITVG